MMSNVFAGAIVGLGVEPVDKCAVRLEERTVKLQGRVNSNPLADNALKNRVNRLRTLFPVFRRSLRKLLDPSADNGSVLGARLSVAIDKLQKLEVLYRKYRLKFHLLLTGSLNVPANQVGGSLNVPANQVGGSLNVPNNQVGGSLNVPANQVGGSLNVPANQVGGSLNVPANQVGGSLNVPNNQVGGSLNVPANQVGGTLNVPNNQVGGTLNVPNNQVGGSLNVPHTDAPAHEDHHHTKTNSSRTVHVPRHARWHTVLNEPLPQRLHSFQNAETFRGSSHKRGAEIFALVTGIEPKAKEEAAPVAAEAHGHAPAPAGPAHANPPADATKQKEEDDGGEGEEAAPEKNKTGKKPVKKQKEAAAAAH